MTYRCAAGVLWRSLAKWVGRHGGKRHHPPPAKIGEPVLKSDNAKLVMSPEEIIRLGLPLCSCII
jgi:hypothetical protein